MDSISRAVSRERRFRLVLALTVGTIGWVGLALLGASLLGQRPPHAGFDLDLLLRAGGRVAAGLTPYDPSATAGSLQAEDLFYSYPPPVAQAVAPFARMPLGLALVLWATGATAGFAAVARSLVRRASPQRSGSLVTLSVLAVLPFVYPYAVAVLFGNIDLWLPLAYGLVLLAITAPLGDGRSGDRRIAIAAGVALGLVTVAKLQPAILLVWCLVRGWRERETQAGELSQAWRILLTALATCTVVVAVSVIGGGVAVWANYVDLLRTGSGARLSSVLNIGPGSQLALLLGNERVAPGVSAIAALSAVVLAGWAAIGRPGPVGSLAVAAAASLFVLPVTWFHYPIVMLPFVAAEWARVLGTAAQRRLTVALGVAIVIAGVAVLAPVALWVAVILIVLTVQRSPAPAMNEGSE